jgi:hypothetical protein
VNKEFECRIGTETKSSATEGGRRFPALPFDSGEYANEVHDTARSCPWSNGAEDNGLLLENLVVQAGYDHAEREFQQGGGLMTEWSVWFSGGSESRVGRATPMNEYHTLHSVRKAMKARAMNSLWGSYSGGTGSETLSVWSLT